MEGFSVLIAIVSIVWGVLSIILFFKVWEMTNDIKEIKNKFLYDTLPNQQKVKELKSFTVNGKDLDEGDVVVEAATGREIIIKSILSDGRFICWRDKNKTSMEKYSLSEIETLEEYASHNNK